jgi:hypothetical protein
LNSPSELNESLDEKFYSIKVRVFFWTYLGFLLLNSSFLVFLLMIVDLPRCIGILNSSKDSFTFGRLLSKLDVSSTQTASLYSSEQLVSTTAAPVSPKFLRLDFESFLGFGKSKSLMGSILGILVCF